jgi:hypothetical protein
LPVKPEDFVWPKDPMFCLACVTLVLSHYASCPSDQPFAGDFRFAYHSWEFFSLLFKKSLLFSIIIAHMEVVAVLPDVRYRQRVQKRLTRLRKRLLAFVIKANPECFDHGGRLAPGCFPARIPPEAANLHGLMRRAECKLAMIRCHAECANGKP